MNYTNLWLEFTGSGVVLKFVAITNCLLAGLSAFSPSLDGCFLALPANATKGSVLVYNVMDLQSHCEVMLHSCLLLDVDVFVYLCTVTVKYLLNPVLTFYT